MKPEADAAVKRAAFAEGGNIARMRAISGARIEPDGEAMLVFKSRMAKMIRKTPAGNNPEYN